MDARQLGMQAWGAPQFRLSDLLMTQNIVSRQPERDWSTVRALLSDKPLPMQARLADDQSMAPGVGLAANLIGGPSLRGVIGPGIRAYHGSPHKFDKFDMSRIGTGEGAQAYGHGLYFAENEGVARSYKDALSGAGSVLVKRSGERVAPSPYSYDEMAANYLRGVDNDHDAAIKAYRFIVGAPDKQNQTSQQLHRGILASLERMKSEGTTAAAPGHMYEVNIRANPEQFLDWDRPLGQQAPAVAEVANRAYPVGSGNIPDSEFYRSLGRHIEAGQPRSLNPFVQKYFPERAASSATEVLREAGIPGIKYLDQGSRGAGQGSSNYVVFDDSIIDILKRYGLMGGAIAPTALGIPQAQAPIFAEQ